MNARLMLLAVAAISVVLMAVGCGSDSDDTTPQAQSGGASETQSDGGSEGQGQEGSEAEGDAQSGEGGEGSADEGGEGSSSASGDFVKDASTACSKAREGSFEKIDVYRKKFESEGLSGAKLTDKAVKTVLLQTLEGEIAGIEELASEAEDPEAVETVVAEMQATFKEAQAKAKTDMTYAEIEGLFGETDKTLEQLGLSSCSKSA